MPFADGARIEVTNECSEHQLILYFYIDYEEYDRLPDDSSALSRPVAPGKPHRRHLGRGDAQRRISARREEHDGRGQLRHPGGGGPRPLRRLHLNIHNLRVTDKWNWYGEGDDMIFIDGEPFPPSLHGTGTEDYFNTAWCPDQEVCTPYHGIILGGGPNWSGKITLYRYHIEDPIMFEKSIKVTIEHGHNNHRSDDYSSTAYWYQVEPHKPFPKLPPVEQRLPREEQEWV